MIYDYVESPIGKLLLAADDSGLRYIGFELGRHPVWIGDDWQRDHAALSAARAQLDAYFAGELIPGSRWVPVDRVGREVNALGLARTE